MKIFKKIKGILITFSICFIIPFFSFFVLNLFFSSDNSTFTTNYSLCGVDIGGLTKLEAENKLSSKFINSTATLKLELTYKDKSWTFFDKDFEINSNIHTVLENAYKTNRKGGYFEKLRNLKRIKNMGFDSQIAVKYVLTDIDKKIDDICFEIETKPVNSTAVYNLDTKSFDITKSSKGILVDREKLLCDIEEGLQKSCDVKIEISTLPVDPEFNESHMKKATKLQASFSTDYAKSPVDRKNNIMLASKSLNGFKVEPNEIFSFNEAVGQRTIEKGYKEANIIKEGTFIKGLGGGVCQVSSTLYNALLLANVEIIECHKHSLPVTYVKPAFDAMVSWGNADLKFKNISNLPIFITANANGKELSIKIYGDTKPDNLEIKPTYEIVKTLPHNGDKIIPDTEGIYGDKIMFKGEFFRVKYPKDGYEAKAYLEYYVDGNLQNKKLIRHGTYNPQQGVLYEGTDTLPKDMTLPKT